MSAVRQLSHQRKDFSVRWAEIIRIITRLPTFYNSSFYICLSYLSPSDHRYKSTDGEKLVQPDRIVCTRCTVCLRPKKLEYLVPLCIRSQIIYNGFRNSFRLLPERIYLVQFYPNESAINSYPIAIFFSWPSISGITKRQSMLDLVRNPEKLLKINVVVSRYRVFLLLIQLCNLQLVKSNFHFPEQVMSCPSNTILPVTNVHCSMSVCAMWDSKPQDFSFSPASFGSSVSTCVPKATKLVQLLLYIIHIMRLLTDFLGDLLFTRHQHRPYLCKHKYTIIRQLP